MTALYEEIRKRVHLIVVKDTRAERMTLKDEILKRLDMLDAYADDMYCQRNDLQKRNDEALKMEKR